MLRLRFWEASVRGEIAKAYGPQINAALAKEGLSAVDVGALSRKDALAVIDERTAEANGSLGPDPRPGSSTLEPVDDPRSAWCR